MNILYNIKIKLTDKRFDRTLEYNKQFNHQIMMEDDLIYGNDFLISKEHILSYFTNEIDKYETDNTANSSITSSSDLEVDEFELYCSSKEYEVFFENEEDDDTYTLTPSIKVHVYEKEIPLPILKTTGELVGDNNIKISWEQDSYAHVILNEKLEELYKCSIGETTYLETDLEYNTEYVRYVIANDGIRNGDLGNPIFLKTNNKSIEEELLGNYTEEVVYEYNEEEHNVIDERLIAFQSGVGSNNDCKIYKGDLTENTFNVPVNFSIKGTKSQTVKYYPKVTSGYRYKVDAKYKELERNATLTINAKAFPREKVIVRLYKYAFKPITVKWKLTGRVAYIVKSGSEYKSYIHNLAREGTYTITAQDCEILYTAKGYATLKVATKNIVDNKTIRTMLTEEARKNSTFSSALTNHIQFIDMRIYDNYATDCDEIYNETNNYYQGNDGTLRIGPGHDNKPALDDSIVLKGYANACLYTKEIIKEIELLGGTEETIAFTEEELSNNLKCVANTNLSASDFASVTTNLEVLNSNVNVSSVLKDKNMYLKVISNLSATNKKYTFDLANPNRTINYCDLFSLPSDYDKFKNYEIEIDVIGCTNSIYCGTQEITVGTKLIRRSAMTGSITFESKSYLIEYEYSEIFPPTNEECNHVAINGKDDENVLIHNGKNDALEIAHKFSLDHRFYDIKYSIVLEKDTVSPSNANVDCYYPSTNSKETEINGDAVVFTSSYYDDRTYNKTDIVANKTVMCSLKDGFKQNISTNIVVPSTVGSTYTDFKLNVYTPISDVLIDYYKDISIYGNIFTPSCSINLVKFPSSKWNPLIHNGYYYYNQHEFYLAAEGKPTNKDQIIEEKIDNGFVLFNLVITTIDNLKLYNDFSFSIPFDGEEHVIIEDVNVLIESWSNSISLNVSDISIIEIEQTDSNSELIYEFVDNKVTGSIKAKSYEIKSICITSGEYEINDAQFFLSPLPQQFSPIMIESEIYGPLTYISNLKGDKGSLILNEEFTITDINKNIIMLKHTNIDKNKTVITNNDKKITDYEIKNNAVIINEILENGELKVQYQVQNSFTIDFDAVNDRMKVYTNTLTPIGKSKISYETSKESNKMILDHLSLNPVHNIDYSGFMYIDENEYSPYSVDVYAEDYLYSNVSDYCNVIISVKDINKNPVSDVFIALNISNGTCEIDNSQQYTDANGVLQFLYHAPNEQCNAIITASITLENGKNLVSEKKITIKERL